jgi:hypothetical protein
MQALEANAPQRGSRQDYAQWQSQIQTCQFALANQRVIDSYFVSSRKLTLLAPPTFLHHLLFFWIALYAVNGQNLFQQSCRLYRHAVFLLQLQECGLGISHAKLFALKLQATRARVLNSSSPLKLLACQIHSQSFLVDHCNALQIAIIHRATSCWARDEDEAVIGCMLLGSRAMDCLWERKIELDYHIKDCLVRRKMEKSSKSLERESPRIPTAKIRSILTPSQYEDVCCSPGRHGRYRCGLDR